MRGTSWFNHYFRFGPDPETCMERIEFHEPQVVAVSCFAWGYAKTTLNLLQLLKEHWYGRRNPPLLVVGGAGATVMPEYFTTFADLIITGEGENAIGKIEMMAGRSSYPSCGEIVKSAPPLDFSFVWDIKSRRNNRTIATTMLSRGCPKMCGFCSNHLVFGKTQRKTDLSEVYTGLDRLVDQVSGNNLHLNFEDDNILFQKEYFLAILKYIKNKCNQKRIDFSFSTENGMDYLLLDHETLLEFKDLNLTQLNLSMASMDRIQLEGEKRAGNLKKMESVLEHSEKLAIPVITYFICGLKKHLHHRTIKELIR